MKISEIKELLELLEQSTIEEFEMEKSGVRVRFRKASGSSRGMISSETETVSPEPTIAELPAEQPTKEEEPENSFHLFKAPIVGTFYVSPKPDAEPFVDVGVTVEVGTVLCIVEAMKIFNQIESDVTGEIIEVLAENGQPVEFGQPLFKIRLS